MTLYEKIMTIYPDLTVNDFFQTTGTIHIQNDSNKNGDYIKEWSHPIYTQPTEQQLQAIK